MQIILFCILIILFIIYLFSSPKFSPIPYFPTSKKDLPLIIKALGLKNNQTVVDLGAGDGVVIFGASKIAFKKKLKTKFIMIEINPILVFVLHLRRLFSPNKKNIKIIYGDIFKSDFLNFTNFQDFITFYIYISPWLIDKLIKNCKLKTKNFSIISYMYPSKILKSREKIINGYHHIYVYN